MDFSDLSSYPVVANTDYSPTNESLSYPDTFDKHYLADAYTTQPDYSLDSFFDYPVTSVEPDFLPSKRHSSLNSGSILPAAAASYPAAISPASPFSRLDQTQFGSPDFSLFNPSTTESVFDSKAAIPTRQTSRTPSLCGDGPQLPTTQYVQPQHRRTASSPSLSPRSLKRESPSSPTDLSALPETKRPLRKRGRPRLDRISTCESTSTASTPATQLPQKQQRAPHPHRLPHNQVERKYREGLNSELERLRRAVPTLPQSDDSAVAVMGQPKPSKAMVLAGAIEYIKMVERERDEAVRECERLRSGCGRADLDVGFGGWGTKTEFGI